MTIPVHIFSYMQKFSEDSRPTVSSGLAGIEQVVVIPALAEKDSLFATLACLSRNSRKELDRTLVLCVINNRKGHIASPQDIENNQETIGCLQTLIKGFSRGLEGDKKFSGRLKEICCPPLRLAYIDASSLGREMPDKDGGVGAARRIGMDSALKVFDYAATGKKLLLCLDADTLVDDDYLDAVRGFFDGNGASAAVVNFSHQRPATADERLAICAYEIFLRYYVLGLRYAGSPYAFHTIGSTIVCTADAYVAVRGMNKRDAAEDFYFLNKLAKLKAVGRIAATTVHPSARPSWRVPFGTGQRVSRFLEGGRDEFLLYDPRVFSILKRWLDEMKLSPERNAEEIMELAGRINPLLPSFLEMNNFSGSWERIKRNFKDREGRIRHFHSWFDAFRTMKLVHFLTDRGFPQIDMFSAVERLLRSMDRGLRDQAPHSSL